MLAVKTFERAAVSCWMVAMAMVIKHRHDWMRKTCDLFKGQPLAD